MSDEKATDASAAKTPATEEQLKAVEAKLKEYGLDGVNVSKVRGLGVESVDDLAMLKEDDLVESGMKVVQARKLLASLQPEPAADAAALGTAAASFDVLPSVPDDGSWLEALKVGGVLRVEQSTVISIIRAALADRVGLYEVPKKLVAAMEQFADENDEQVDPAYFALRKQLSRKNYAEVFEAIDGLDGSYVTDARKQQLFERVNSHLWPAILSFFEQLRGWQETWREQGMNPSLMLAFVSGAPVPPGIVQPPDTGGLRDYADAINDAINRVFAGTGVQIAAALAYDASQIRKSLEDPRLPSPIGAANRDQMLKKLGVAVNSTSPRLETNLTRFVLACMQAKDQPAGNEEMQYFGTLYMLGNQIPWSELGGRSAGATGIGNRPL